MHIYAVTNSYSDILLNYNLLVSNSKGDFGSWNNIFTSNSKIYAAKDPNAKGKFYFASGYNVYYSDNFGASFIGMFTFTRNVVGLYKKPDCPSLFIATTDTIYEYNGSSLHAIRGLLLAADDKSEMPAGFSLSQNYPNPFNPVTVIKYSVASAEKVKITVYDILGKKINDLLNEYKSAGAYEISFNGSSLPSGVYFYKIETGTYTETKKMVLVR